MSAVHLLQRNGRRRCAHWRRRLATTRAERQAATHTDTSPRIALFASDNASGAHQDVLRAVAEANSDRRGATAYGSDEWTARAARALAAAAGGARECTASFVFGGTGANVLSLAALLRPFEAILAADVSHLALDEAGAPERHIGCKLIALRTGERGKIQPSRVEEAIYGVGDQHSAQPAVLSITNSTECGTVYSSDEMKELRAVCDKHSLLLHIDGARLANAAASRRCSPAEILCDADVASFGFTKNGALFGEAVVLLGDAARVQQAREEIKFFRKQAMQLPSKMRFISAQVTALLEPPPPSPRAKPHHTLWYRNARQANKMASRLAKFVDLFSSAYDIRLTRPVEANAVFCAMPMAVIRDVQQTYDFYVWNEKINEVRLMCNYATTEEDIDKFVQALKLAFERHK